MGRKKGCSVGYDDGYITVLNYPDVCVHTAKGSLRFEAWLERERVRVGKKGVRAEIVRHASGVIGLRRVNTSKPTPAQADAEKGAA